MAVMIPPKAQAIIARLAAIDYAQAHLDRDIVEQALMQHLDALGIRRRPVRWMGDAKAAFKFVLSAAHAADWIAAKDAAARDVVEATIWGAAWNVARAAAWEAALNAAWAAAWEAAWNAGWAVTDPWESAGYVSCLVAAYTAGSEVKPHPALEKWVAIWSPFVDAWEAGLWLFRVTPRAVRAVPRPSIVISEGRLHCPDGPAVFWPHGPRYYFWRGVQVPERVILRAETLSGRDILEERNVEVRRAMVEKIGIERFFALIGKPKPIHTDETGELYRITLQDDPEPLCAVHVTDPSTGRRYFLRVPPDMQRARQAVAWTFGMDEQAWAPAVET